MAAELDLTAKIRATRERKLARCVSECADKLDACAAEIDKRYGRGFAKANAALLGAFFSVVIAKAGPD